MNIDTENTLNIFKVGMRVFKLGEIDYDENFIKDIIYILDKGFKFVPTYNVNSFDLKKSFFENINNEMFNFNKQVFQKDIYNVNKDVTSNYNNSLNYVNSSGNNIEDSFDNFYKINRKKPDFSKVPLNSESLKFYLEIFCESNNLRIDNISNLSKTDINRLKFFNKNKPFKVVELDKNIGSGIISNENYINLVNKELGKKEVYLKIDENPLDEIIIKYKELFLSHSNKNYISKRMMRYLNKDEFKLGNFRILPKLHKEKFSIRPIINYRENVSEKMCTVVDYILRPFVKESDSYILDSQNLIQKTQNISIPKNAKLYSCDFESLYTNIDHNECVNVISDFLKDKLDNSELNIISFRDFLSFILYNNYFCFGDGFYKQVSGIAMGSVAGPSIANMFVMIYEIKWCTIHRPLIYYRFIDDIFVVLLHDQNINDLKLAFGSLILKCVSGKNVQFLDVDISIDPFTQSLCFKVYFKPTNTFCYLYIDSNHRSSIFENIIKTVFIRIRRICTKFNDFIFFTSIIKNQLIDRGYDVKLINKIFTMISKLDRDHLLLYKEKKSINYKENFFFINTHDSNILNQNEIVKKASSNLKENNEKFINYNLVIVDNLVIKKIFLLY